MTVPVAAALALLASAGQAQAPGPVRPIGPITAISRDSLASVAAAVPVSGGRVFVNDIAAHRVILFDSTLAKGRVVADSTGATANAYGGQPGTLVKFRGDSVLLITPGSLSMLVLSPDGKIVRTLAMPTGRGMNSGLIGSIFGTPAFDAKGRMAFYSGAVKGNRESPEQPDSAFVVRIDLLTRQVDTAASFRIPRAKGDGLTRIRDDQGRMRVFGRTAFPPQTVDDWAVMADGAIALLRGRDYHVDWLTPDGTWRSTPKMPFAWEHVGDAEKTALLDSAFAAQQTIIDSLQARFERTLAGGSGAAISRNRNVEAPERRPRISVVRAELADVPDYRPAFGQGALQGDAENRLWVHTTTVVDGRPVYDVVNRKGELIDRMQLPAFRTIAGFGPGIIYMAVRDSANVVHVERARVRR